MNKDRLYAATFDEERSRHAARPVLEPSDQPLTFFGKVVRIACYEAFAWALQKGADGNYWPLAGMMILALWGFCAMMALLLTPLAFVHPVMCPAGQVWLVTEHVCVRANSLIPAQ